MSLEFSAMQLVFGNSSPSVAVLSDIFADNDEEKISIEDGHYLIYKRNVSDKYFWIYVKYGKELPYTPTVINTSNDEEEVNPRSKEQIEPDQQVFGLYFPQNQTFYISSIRKKAFFETYLSKKINQPVTIKSFLKTPDEFLKVIKSIEKIKLVTKRTLFSMDGGVVSISPEHKDIFGLGMPEEYSIEAVYKNASLTEAFISNIKEMAGWTKSTEAESLVCIGRDDKNLETIFNVDSFRQKIAVLVEKDTYGMYDENSVLTLLQLKLEGK